MLVGGKFGPPVFVIAAMIEKEETYWEKMAKELLKKVGLNEHPNTLITNLGTGKQQLVEIAKALNKKVKLLILDEPTSSLNETDSNALLELLKGFRAQGISSILISHKLNEISRVADRITIIRDGASVSTLTRSNGATKPVMVVKGCIMILVKCERWNVRRE